MLATRGDHRLHGSAKAANRQRYAKAAKEIFRFRCTADDVGEAAQLAGKGSNKGIVNPSKPLPTMRQLRRPEINLAKIPLGIMVCSQLYVASVFFLVAVQYQWKMANGGNCYNGVGTFFVPFFGRVLVKMDRRWNNGFSKVVVRGSLHPRIYRHRDEGKRGTGEFYLSLGIGIRALLRLIVADVMDYLTDEWLNYYLVKRWKTDRK